MKHIGMTSLKFDVSALKEELFSSPFLWNQVRHRTSHPQSPHRDIDDIWVRYNALENFNGDMKAFNAQHIPVWYPCVENIPSARILSVELFEELNAKELGGVLITRVPAHREVFPHIDNGWHARYYEKFVIQIASAPGQSFCFEDGEFESLPGDCYWFDNSFPHWVTNPTDSDRISLIICVRRA